MKYPFWPLYTFRRRDLVTVLSDGSPLPPQTKLGFAFRLEDVDPDPRLATEEGYKNFDLALLLIDFIDLATEIGERTIDDPNRIPERERDVDLRRLGLHLLEDVRGDIATQRHRLVILADKPGHTGGIAQLVPGILIHLHADEHIPGEDLALDSLSLPILDFDLFLGRNHDLEDPIAHVECLDTAFDGLLDLVFISRVRVQHVPLAFELALRDAGFFGSLRGQALAQ